MDLSSNGTPPVEDTSLGAPDPADILETLSLNEPAPAAITGAATEPGAAETAPAAPVAPATETPSAGTEASPQPAAPAPTEGTPPGSTEPAVAPSDKQSAAPQPQPAADGDAALREASLKATVDALQREIAAIKANPPAAPASAGPTAAAPESGGQPAEEKPFRYSLTLPEATQKALLSEDPQQNLAAINAIVNDLGTIVHNTVLTQVRGEVKEAFGHLISLANQSQVADTQTQEREKGREAYFKAFPAHKNDMIEPIIRAQAVALSAEHPNLPFNDQFINALGARVNGVLEQLGAKPSETSGEPTATATSTTAPPKPAGFVPSGTRTEATGSPSANLGDEIHDLLSPF